MEPNYPPTNIKGYCMFVPGENRLQEGCFQFVKLTTNLTSDVTSLLLGKE